jgi:long-chain acyl-CoA synthetase
MLGCESQVRGYQHVRAIHILPEGFTQDNGLVTVTGRLDRKAIRECYAAEITALYSSPNMRVKCNNP